MVGDEKVVGGDVLLETQSPAHLVELLQVKVVLDLQNSERIAVFSGHTRKIP